jgi:sulfoacetaldehyde acetyltransferase
MGVQGVRVDRLEAVGPTLHEACEDQRAGKSTVLEVMVTRELGDPFRRDALSKPVRHLEKYRDYV